MVRRGLGWVGSGRGLHRRRVPTGSNPGCLVSQPQRPLTTLEPHQGAVGMEMLPCLCVFHACRGGLRGGSGDSGAPLFFSGGLRSSCWRVGGGWCQCSGAQQWDRGALH